MAPPKFELVHEETEQPAQPAKPDPALALSTQMLTIALSALSQKALIALASLFSITLAGTAFFLWWMILPNPSINQLVGLGMYAVFILALHYIRYRGAK